MHYALGFVAGAAMGFAWLVKKITEQVFVDDRKVAARSLAVMTYASPALVFAAAGPLREHYPPRSMERCALLLLHQPFMPAPGWRGLSLVRRHKDLH